ncbi:MAG: hypothetical protein R3321_15545, partial [Nitrososphaeraceae archaeon]|nr:hypothetical protein [Nitrososphaeraceae archaeon]
RFSPGYQKEFVFRSGETIIINDTTTQSLEARFTYKELFGLGYSYNFNSQFSAGFSFRFFNQDFNQEIVKPVFGDTLFLVRENLNEKVNFWKADLGLNYKLNDQFAFAVHSINLLNFGDDIINDEFQGFELKTESGVLISASYNPAEVISLNAIYETSSSFQLSTTGKHDNFIYGVTAFHDKYQSPFIAGIIPSLGYKTNLFEVMLSGVKYFSERNVQHNFSQFQQEGIHNIINNKYSFDKILFSVSFNIDATHEQRVKLIDVELADNIYPAFTDLYLEKPIAYGTVVNLTDENLAVRLSVKIEGVNESSIFSPETVIKAKDTLKIPYYTIIPDNY